MQLLAAIEKCLSFSIEKGFQLDFKEIQLKHRKMHSIFLLRLVSSGGNLDNIAIEDHHFLKD